jgi:uncharacterized membrane protein
MFKLFHFGKKQEIEHSNKWIFGTMLAFGLLGLLAAFILSVEKIHLLQNPGAVLSCSFNVVLDCSTVMKTWQASLFGFPNSFIGLMGYSVVVTVAVIGLAGAKLPKWFWRIALICYGLGAIFAYWLFFNSVYVIEVLCPWCLLVTLATTLVFAALKHFVLRENIWSFNKSFNVRIQSWLNKDFDKLFFASWLVLLMALVFIKFGDSLFL